MLPLITSDVEKLFPRFCTAPAHPGQSLGSLPKSPGYIVNLVPGRDGTDGTTEKAVLGCLTSLRERFSHFEGAHALIKEPDLNYYHLKIQ